MRIVRNLLLALLVATPIAACGTVEGVGKDVSGSARWVRDKIF